MKKPQVHWDHIGEPRDFAQSTFVVGHGAKGLLSGQDTSLRGGHSFFEADLLPPSRTVELCDTHKGPTVLILHASKPGRADFHQGWTPHGCIPKTIDVFQDGSLLIVDAPGHLPGHINLLARTGLTESVYLAGDACHDRRIMRREKAIGQWKDAHGQICCIHADKAAAEETIERIRQLEQAGVEVIFAHDVEWEQIPTNKSRFWGSGG